MLLLSSFLSPSLSPSLLPPSPSLLSLAVTLHFLTGFPLILFYLPLLPLSLSRSPFSPEGVEALPDAMKSWKDLTDRFDDLSIWLEELEERVESDLVKVEEVEGGGDPSDTIVNIKVSFESLKTTTENIYSSFISLTSRTTC